MQTIHCDLCGTVYDERSLNVDLGNTAFQLKLYDITGANGNDLDRGNAMCIPSIDVCLSCIEKHELTTDDDACTAMLTRFISKCMTFYHDNHEET